MDLSFLLPDELRLLDCQPGEMLLVSVALRTCSGRCPLCQRPSRRVHSRYWRTLADLPLGEQPVCLRLRIRRFFCGNPCCRRRIFAERLPQLAADYAQRTERLRQAQTRLAQCVGSRPGGRLAKRLEMSTSATTLLRLERAAPLPVLPTPRVLGVDDWAFKKGHRYGTILVDQERRWGVDLLPDRTAETLAQWLRERPGVEIVTRDRAEAYAEGIRLGAPQALQVADRWHIVKNLGQALERFLDDKRSLIQQATQPSPASEEGLLPGAQEPSPEAISPKETRTDLLKRCHRRQRLERYQEVCALWEQGISQVAIAQRLQMDRRTVRKFLRADGFPERKERASSRQPRRLDAYGDYLRSRWEQGCHNGLRLLEELRQRGYTGGYTTLKDFLLGLRAPAASAALVAPKRIAPRQLAAWALQRKPDRTPKQAAVLDRLGALCEPFRLALDLLDRFLGMIRQAPRTDQATALQAWEAEAQECGIAPLQNFAKGLQQDQAAVEAGLSLCWSNGTVEGSVNRLKFVKRRGYGRANFDLLRRRVLQPT